MDRLWKTDGDYCMLLVRLVAGAVFLIHAATIAIAGGASPSGPPPALVLVGGVVEFLGSIGLLIGLLARISAGAILFEAATGLMLFGNTPQGRSPAFYLLAGTLMWVLIVHGAGPYSIDSWLTRRVAVKPI